MRRRPPDGWRRLPPLGNADAQLEYAIALGSGKGVPKDEAGAVALFRLAAERGNAVAQNRLARAYSAGVWLGQGSHSSCKMAHPGASAGESDLRLDFFVMSLRPEERKQAEALAQAWREQTAEAAR